MSYNVTPILIKEKDMSQILKLMTTKTGCIIL